MVVHESGLASENKRNVEPSVIESTYTHSPSLGSALGFNQITRRLFNKQFISEILSSNIYLSLCIKLFVVIMIGYLALTKYQQYQDEQSLTNQLIATPKINDIYFLDFRLFNESLRPKEKYRIAKVFDITGDVLTLRYGDLLFPSKHKADDSIRFGQLSYKEYFQPERFDFSLDEIVSLREKGAIYLAKRPFQNKVFGNFVSPSKPSFNSSLFIQGRKEYLSGVAHFDDQYDELGLNKAFDYFTQSAKLGFIKGQIRLAEMYLSGVKVNRDINLALYWLKQAALQSNKRAILKYGIVCKKVESCNIVSFYQELIESGVNLKVRDIDVKLSSSSLD